MINIKIVYNSEAVNNEEFAWALTSVLQGMGVEYEIFDVKYKKERDKGFKVKGAFSARLDPFVGVYDGRLAVKGFYSEVGEVNVMNVIDYIEEKQEELDEIEKKVADEKAKEDKKMKKKISKMVDKYEGNKGKHSR